MTKEAALQQNAEILQAAIGDVLGSLRRIERLYLREREKFSERAEKDPAQAVRNAGELLRLQAKRNFIDPYLQTWEARADERKTVDALIEVVTDMRSCTLSKQCRYTGPQGSEPLYLAIDAIEAEARTELLSDYELKMYLGELQAAKDAVQPPALLREYARCLQCVETARAAVEEKGNKEQHSAAVFYASRLRYRLDLTEEVLAGAKPYTILFTDDYEENSHKFLDAFAEEVNAQLETAAKSGKPRLEELGQAIDLARDACDHLRFTLEAKKSAEN